MLRSICMEYIIESSYDVFYMIFVLLLMPIVFKSHNHRSYSSEPFFFQRVLRSTFLPTAFAVPFSFSKGLDEFFFLFSGQGLDGFYGRKIMGEQVARRKAASHEPKFESLFGKKDCLCLVLAVSQIRLSPIKRYLYLKWKKKKSS